MRKRTSWMMALMLAVISAGFVWGASQSSGKATDPVCGMSVDKATAKWTYAYKGETYYFCGESCKAAFAKDPEKYLAGPAAGKPMRGMMGQGMMQGRMMRGQAADPAKATDPVCGMSVDKAAAKGKSEYKGSTYYFCSEVCKTLFDKEPEKYLAAQAEAGEPMEHGQGMAGGGMMSLPDVERKVQVVPDGIIVTMTSRNPETVKRLHEHAAKMAEEAKK